MGIQNNLNVIVNSRRSLLHLAMLTSIVAVTAASFSSSDNVVAAQDSSSSSPLDTRRSVAIPFCDEKHERTIGRRLLYVTTLDGRLSALDITKGGKLRWSIPTGPGPLISSSIHRLELTNNGQFVRMIPSLSGGIYKFDGESIDPIPITTENLLSSSARFSEDLVISGGKETRTYGVSARTGKLLYECSMHGCSNATDANMNVTPAPPTQHNNYDDDNEEDAAHDYLKEHDPLVDDIIVVRRQTQTVRAVESRTGAERWNFSVGQHELDLVKPSECHDRQFSDMDMAILDLDIRVIVPEGVIYAFSKSEPNTLLWKYKFDHPIVSSWKISAADKLESIDMFGSAQWLWDQDDNIFESPFPSISPSIYLGMYEKQLYIQESVNLRREIVDQSNLYTHLTTESHMPIIPWRPIPASSNSLILFQNDDDKFNTLPGNLNEVTTANTNIYGNELVPYDEENFAISAQSVLNGSEYVNGNGFYLFTRDDLNDNNAEALCDSEEVDDDDMVAIADETGGNETNHTLSNDLDFNLDDLDAPVKVVILSLWFWWKEIIVIAITTAVLLNLFIGSRQRPEVVVIERHIPVPTAYEATESSTQALLGPVTNGTTTTTTGTTKSTINGMLTNGVPNRSLSESTSISGENFSSRFQGDFDLVRCLGRGGFGVVFEAKNKLDDCKYAVKRITLPNKKESRERVMREVKTLANCEHQNIVRYFQAWVETPPPGWQEEEDSKLLAHEMSTSIQIETPDGTTLPSFAYSLPAIEPPHGRLQKEKKKQLISWVSSVTSTACSSDHDDDNCIKEVNENEEEDDDDSLIVFRTESESMALREEDDEEYADTDESNVNQKQPHKSQSNAVAIDIHSKSLSLDMNGGGRGKMMNGKHIDYSQLSDSFQIEFVRSANGDDDGFATDDDEAANDADQSASKSNSKQKRSIQHLALDLKNNNNNNNNNCKDLLPAGKVITPPHSTPSPLQKPMQNKVYLYIQMQLCRKESLRDWLRENKTEARENHIGSIFHQIVDAVDYVHLKGLIHRDLKPSNIFFSQDGQIKIGDFGLVTDMSDIPNMIMDCGDTSGLPSCARHTQQVGTHLYMSPEQLRGQHYDYKVDIYSLGLIFFELLVHFGTEMERIVTLRDLRDGRYPKQFPVDFSKEYDLLKLMLSPKPEERPATLDLKLKLSDILQLPELLVGDSEAATLAAVARRLSRSRTISSSE